MIARQLSIADALVEVLAASPRPMGVPIPSPPDAPPAFTAADACLRFLLAGNARVTLVSRKTGTRFTYRVAAVREKRGPVTHFVSLLIGPSNDSDYRYLGTVREVLGRDVVSKVFSHGGAKAVAKATTPSALAFAWFFGKLLLGQIPDELEVHHEGHCGRCGRALTVPESVLSGLGPECAGRS